MNILYVAEGGITCSVFESQVFHLLRALHKERTGIKLILLEEFSCRNNPCIKKRLPEIKALFPECIDMATLPIMGRFTANVDSLRLRNIVGRKWSDGGVIDLIHARGHIGSYIAMKAFPKARTIADIRGLLSGEIRCYSEGLLRRVTSGFRAAEMDKIEKHVFANAKRFFCVSNNLREYIIRRSQTSNEMVTVIPTVVDTDYFYYDAAVRCSLRQELGIGGRVVFVYSGGLGRWQIPGKMIGMFEGLKKSIPEAFLIILTNDVETAGKYVSHLKRDDYIVTRAQYTEVAKFLNAADIGLLIREGNPVNQAAAPTKFGEYLCCGLPVVVTRGIGDTETTIADLKAGVLMDDMQAVPDRQSVLDLLRTDRSAVSSAAGRLFSVNSNVKKILQAYSEVAAIK